MCYCASTALCSDLWLLAHQLLLKVKPPTLKSLDLSLNTHIKSSLRRGRNVNEWLLNYRCLCHRTLESSWGCECDIFSWSISNFTNQKGHCISRPAQRVVPPAAPRQLVYNILHRFKMWVSVILKSKREGQRIITLTLFLQITCHERLWCTGRTLRVEISAGGPAS